MTSENQKEMTIVALTIDDRARSSMLATYPVVKMYKNKPKPNTFCFYKLSKSTISTSLPLNLTNSNKLLGVNDVLASIVNG